MSGHLLVLDIAHAAIGIHDRDLNAVLVLEALECGLARIARGGNENEEHMIDHAFFTELPGALAEEVRQALKRHIFEGARRSMPKLEHVGLLIERRDRTDVFGIESSPVGRLHQVLNRLIVKIGIECLVDLRSALRIRKIG